MVLDLLRPEEYGQMAGRAGRRGIDTFGTVIILPENDMISESEAKKMITSPPQKISSRLEIDYSYVLKRMALKIEENNDESVVSYLANSITNTLLSNELDNKNNIYHDELDELKEKYHQFSDLKEFYDKFTEIKDIENRLEIQKTSFIKMI